MTPAQLKPESFQSYQPEARSLAEQHLALLRTLPLSFLPLLLREVIAYDRKFPAERRALEYQFRYLDSLPEAAREKELAPFRAIRVEGDLQQMDWVGQPARFRSPGSGLAVIHELLGVVVCRAVAVVFLRTQ